ncbi:MAG: tRNA (guanosine(37)-N1)-methyltransferase TrmD [Oscillospiraceae bacterium]|nr:tRNA (guanosine(37)-N1)-methyltransferase TrmD [Oscillospiraceae bacterium]
MRIEIATLFPEMCLNVLDESIIGRARKGGKIEVNCRNIRDYTQNKHRKVDDSPFGGGKGMVMQAQPIYDCYKAVCNDFGCVPHTIYMSPKGKPLTQKRVKELALLSDILIICGHYEGVDQRVLDKIAPEEISIGDYVLTGGELPALVLTDSIARLCEGVLPASECFEEESHWNGLLEYPQYTRPEMWEGMPVPEILLSGHHKNIESWRLQKSLELTKQLRPDMLESSK